MAKYYSVPVVDGKADMDLKKDSFRVMHYTVDLSGNKIMYGEFNSGNVRDSWTELTEEEFFIVVPKKNNVTMTQLDRIEEKLNKSYIEAKQEGADAITAELIERGLL